MSTHAVGSLNQGATQCYRAFLVWLSPALAVNQFNSTENPIWALRKASNHARSKDGPAKAGEPFGAMSGSSPPPKITGDQTPTPPHPPSSHLCWLSGTPLPLDWTCTRDNKPVTPTLRWPMIHASSTNHLRHKNPLCLFLVFALFTWNFSPSVSFRGPDTADWRSIVWWVTFTCSNRWESSFSFCLWKSTFGNAFTAVCVSDKAKLEGKVMRRAECRPTGDSSYMNLKK